MTVVGVRVTIEVRAHGGNAECGRVALARCRTQIVTTEKYYIFTLTAGGDQNHLRLH